MTPLAQRWVAEMAKPLSQRKLIDNGNVSKRIMGATFFDCTEVYQAAVEMAECGKMDKPSEILAFLPAPATWIEVTVSPSLCFGFLLTASDDESGIWATVRVVRGDGLNCEKKTSFFGGIMGMQNSASTSTSNIHVDPKLYPDSWDGIEPRKNFREKVLAHWNEEELQGKILYALLAMINSPRVIGRRQKAIGFTAARKLLKAQKTVGKFPLRAWTEIVLEVTPPKVAEDAVQEATLTGRRALHFVRQHLRIWNGRLILVSAHWRGDGALGIKQTRYRLTKPKGRAA